MAGQNKLYSLSELLEKEIKNNSECYNKLIIYSKDRAFRDLKYMLYITLIVLIIHKYIIGNNWEHGLIYIGLYIWYPFTFTALVIYLYHWYQGYNRKIISLLTRPQEDGETFDYYGYLVDKNIIYTLAQWGISEDIIQLWYSEKLFEEEFILKLNNSLGPNIGKITKKSWQSLSLIANNGEKNILTEFLISLIEYNSHFLVYLKIDT